jgi:hypothetical protein
LRIGKWTRDAGYPQRAAIAPIFRDLEEPARVRIVTVADAVSAAWHAPV